MAQKLLIVFSFGQSLSIGTTTVFERLTDEPEHPGAVLGLDWGNIQLTARGFLGNPVAEEDFAGFIDLVEGNRETPGSAMLNQIYDRYEQDGLEPPLIVHFHAGSGGRSIVELLTSASDIFASTEDALASVADGDHFAVDNLDGTLSHYINDGGTAVFTKSTPDGTVYFDNFETQLRLVVEEALEQGYVIEPAVVLNWIQGQSDVGLSREDTFDYGYHLNLLLDKITETIQEVVSPTTELIASLSQFRGTGIRETPIQTLEVINERADSHLGITEYAFQAFEPSVVGKDYTHLTSEGYYRAGRALGDRIYDALTGNENKPILIDSIEYLATNEILITFSGVETQLVDDPSIYRADAGFTPPSHFGFGLYAADGTPGTGTPQIVESEIVGTNQVRLVFDQEITQEYRLFLGRTGENLIDPNVSPNHGIDFGGTTLRDASETQAPTPPSGRTLDDDAISEYAPVQVVQLQANDIVEPPTVDEDLLVDGTATSVIPFLEGSFDFGESDVSADGLGVTLSGNAWRQALIDIKITADTVLTFDFASTGTAEIQGIMFVNDENPNSNRTFQIDGFQKFGRQDFNGQYEGDGALQSYTIPIGQFFTGTFDRIVFLNDDDARNGGTSTYANIDFSTDAGPPSAPDEDLLIDGTPASVISFLDGSFDFGESDVSADGLGVTLSGNAWRQALVDIEITADTVLTFDFAATGTAEIQGIMFVNDENPASTRTFQLNGFQNYGRQDFNGQYEGDGALQSYSIPIGQFFTGTFDRIVFLNDDDARNGGTSTYANIDFSTDAGPPPAPDEDLLIDGTPASVVSFLDGSFDFGASDVTEDGLSVTLSGNAWRQALIDIKITADTVLTFDFAATGTAEIQGIMFVNDENPASTRTFQLNGFQNYGRQDFNGQYEGDGALQSYTIPIGQFFTGTFDRIVFLNDDDARNGGTSTYANIDFSTSNTQAQAQIEDLMINGEPVFAQEGEGAKEVQLGSDERWSDTEQSDAIANPFITLPTDDFLL